MCVLLKREENEKMVVFVSDTCSYSVAGALIHS